MKLNICKHDVIVKEVLDTWLFNQHRVVVKCTKCDKDFDDYFAQSKYSPTSNFTQLMFYDLRRIKNKNDCYHYWIYNNIFKVNHKKVLLFTRRWTEHEIAIRECKLCGKTKNVKRFLKGYIKNGGKRQLTWGLWY